MTTDGHEDLLDWVFPVEVMYTRVVSDLIPTVLYGTLAQMVELRCEVPSKRGFDSLTSYSKNQTTHMKFSLKHLFVVYLNPAFWLQNHPHSKFLSEWYVYKLNDPNILITDIGDHTAKIDGRLMWIANYPYACGCPYPNHKMVEYLPAKWIRYELNKRIERERLRSIGITDDGETTIKNWLEKK